MAVREAKIAELTPDAHNLNKGTPRGADMVERSLQQYGAGRSILVDKHGRVIAGNKTLAGAAAVGLEDVLIVTTDGTKLVVVQREDLDLDGDPRARELSIADNRASEVGLEWDAAELNRLVQEGAVNLDGLFFPNELDAVLREATKGAPEAPEGFPEVGEDLATDYCCPKCGYQWSGKPK